MAKWYPHLYTSLAGANQAIGCPNCRRSWGTLAFDNERDCSSVNEALSIPISCHSCWSGSIQFLVELYPGGWDKILLWWETATKTKLDIKSLATSNFNRQTLVTDYATISPAPSNKGVEEFLKEQRDNNLRAIFG